MQLRYLTLASIVALSSQAWATVVNTSPGQLESMIHTSYSSITELTLGGAINAIDLQFITDKLTSLQSLDMSNVTIVAYEGDALINGSGTANANEIAPYSLAGLTATAITLPRNLVSLGEGALAGSAITAVELPSSVKSIDMGAFAGCRAITTLTIPSTVTSLGEYALKDMTNVTEIDIQASITSVPSAVFAGNTKLTKVTLPSTVTAIDSAAFSGCSALAEISLPKSVTKIGASAFRGTALTDVDLQSLSKLTKVGDWAFADIPTLTSVTLPESVTYIGKGAFFGANALTSINVPESVLEIADYAFADASSMASTQLNDHVTTIGDFALKGWSSTTFNFPANLEYIGDGAMEGWTSIEKLYSQVVEVPTLGDDVWYGVDQANVKLYVPEESVDAYLASPQWEEFDVTSNTGVEDVIADAANESKIKGYFTGTDMIIESTVDMQLVEVYNTGGLKLMSLEPADTCATIDTDGWTSRIFIVRVILADNTPATLKLARR